MSLLHKGSSSNAKALGFYGFLRGKSCGNCLIFVKYSRFPEKSLRLGNFASYFSLFAPWPFMQYKISRQLVRQYPAFRYLLAHPVRQAAVQCAWRDRSLCQGIYRPHELLSRKSWHGLVLQPAQ